MQQRLRKGLDAVVKGVKTFRKKRRAGASIRIAFNSGVAAARRSLS